MIGERELQQFVLDKFQLQFGQVVTGVEVWNALIEAKQFHNILWFLAMDSTFELVETLMSNNPLMNELFGMEKLDSYQREKFQRRYRISDLRIETNIDENDKKYHRITVYAHKRIEKDTKWGKQEIILFAIRTRQ